MVFLMLFGENISKEGPDGGFGFSAVLPAALEGLSGAWRIDVFVGLQSSARIRRKAAISQFFGKDKAVRSWCNQRPFPLPAAVPD